MYIGRLGDGSLPNDGLYVMLKEVVNNADMAQGRVSDICLKTATLRWWAEIAF
jgi:DNA gyrase/topoisomerase IV subunit B